MRMRSISLYTFCYSNVPSQNEQPIRAPIPWRERDGEAISDSRRGTWMPTYTGSFSCFLSRTFSNVGHRATVKKLIASYLLLVVNFGKVSYVDRGLCIEMVTYYTFPCKSARNWSRLRAFSWLH